MSFVTPPLFAGAVCADLGLGETESGWGSCCHAQEIFVGGARYSGNGGGRGGRDQLAEGVVVLSVDARQGSGAVEFTNLHYIRDFRARLPRLYNVSSGDGYMPSFAVAFEQAPLSLSPMI